MCICGNRVSYAHLAIRRIHRKCPPLPHPTPPLPSPTLLLLCSENKVQHSLDRQVLTVLWELENTRGRSKYELSSKVWTHGYGEGSGPGGTVPMGIPTVSPHLTLSPDRCLSRRRRPGETLIPVHWAEEPYSGELKGQRWTLLEEKVIQRSKVFLGKIFLGLEQEGGEKLGIKTPEMLGYSSKRDYLRPSVGFGHWYLRKKMRPRSSLLMVLNHRDL